MFNKLKDVGKMMKDAKALKENLGAIKESLNSMIVTVDEKGIKVR